MEHVFYFARINEVKIYSGELGELLVITFNRLKAAKHNNPTAVYLGVL